jgi:hypothetical protein
MSESKRRLNRLMASWPSPADDNFSQFSRDKPLKRLKTAKLKFGIIWRRCAPEPPFSRQQGKGGLRGLTAIRVRQFCDQLAFDVLGSLVGDLAGAGRHMAAAAIFQA